MLESSHGQGLPAELLHFAIGEHFGVDPQRVMYDWDEELVREARMILDARARYRVRHPS